MNGSTKDVTFKVGNAVDGRRQLSALTAFYVSESNTSNNFTAYVLHNSGVYYGPPTQDARGYLLIG